MRETRGQSELSNAELRVRYAEARERLKQAQQRILELERLLMRTVAQQRTEAAKRDVAQGQPLLDLAEGHAPTPPASEEGDEDDEPVFPPKPPKSSRRGRRKFPAHLPRTIKAYDVQPERDLPDYDPTKGFTIVDYDTCEELQMPRPQPSVIVHKRPVVLYTTLDGETRLATVGGLSKVFPKSAASPELLAKIAVDRLHYHLTLYRIERWFAEHGCPVARSTLSYWMLWLGRLLKPLANAQDRVLEKAFKRHADDTEIRVLAIGECDRVRVWVVLGDVEGGREIRFSFTEARTSDSTQEVLGAHGGYLQVDACGTYDALFLERPLIEVGCWSHVLRRFEEVEAVDSRAKPMLRMIRKLYQVEAFGEDLADEARQALRQLASRPLLAEIKAWVEKQRAAELLESSFKKALNYVVNQWVPLTRYLEDGRLSIDNNVAEGEFHVLGVGRRNHLFWGSRESLESGLILFGLIRSCAANGIDPHTYLVDVIRRTVETETPARLMIPSRWKELPPLAENPPAPMPAVQAADTG
jgi:transposase